MKTLSAALLFLALAGAADIVPPAIIPQPGKGVFGATSTDTANATLTSLIGAWSVPTFTAATNVITAWDNVAPEKTAVGNALQTTGSTQNLTVADNASLSVDTNVDFGMCGWIDNPGDITSIVLIEKENEWRMYTGSSGQVSCQVFDSVSGSTVVNGTALTASKRAFVCAWYTASDKKCHSQLDEYAASDAGAGITNQPLDSTNTVYVARNATGTNVWDSFVFYKGSIPPVSSLYNGGLGKRCSDLTGSDLTNLVACWDLEEASGTRVASSAGSCTTDCNLTPTNTPGNATGLIATGTGCFPGECDLSPTNSPTVTGGATGLGLSLNGTNQYLSVADNAALSGGQSKDLLACGWFWSSAADGNEAFIAKDNGGANREYLLYASTTTIFAYAWSDTDASSNQNITSAVAAGKRGFYCIAVDVSEKKAGVSSMGGAVSWGSAWASGTDIKDTGATFEIGAQAGAITFGGTVDSVTVYFDTTIDFNASITAQFNSGKGLKCADVSTTGLVTCQDLEETSGTRTSDAGSCGSTCDLSPTNTPGAVAGLVQTKDSLGNVSMGARLVHTSSQTVSTVASELEASVEFTFVVWSNALTSVASPVIAGKYGSPAGSAATGSYAIYGTAGTTNGNTGCLAVNQADGQTTATGATAAFNVWAMTTLRRSASYGATEAKCRGNAGADVTLEWDSVKPSSSSAFNFGRNGGNYYSGTVAGVAVWGRALTDAEVTAIYASGAGKFYDFAWQLMLRDPIRFAFRMLYDPFQTFSRDRELRPYAGA